MLLALNLVALLIVLGLCWAAMVWLGERFHGTSPKSEFEFETVAEDEYGRYARRTRIDLEGVHDLSFSNLPCPTCEGSGAAVRHQLLAPCDTCHGTGITS